MVSKEKRELIISNLEQGMSIPEAGRIFGVHRATVWRLQQRYRETQSVESDSRNCGRTGELDEAGLERMRKLVESQPDITLEEIRETMGLRMKKSQISAILRNKLGFRFKKRWYAPVNRNETM